MKYIDIADFRKGSSGYFDLARVETVLITEDGKPQWALISYEVFRELRRDNRRALRVSALSEEDKNAIAEAAMPEEHRYQNDELESDEPGKR